MADQVVTLRIKADGAELSTVSAQGQKDLDKLGVSADGASASLEALSETQNSVVASSLKIVDACSAIEKSQRALAEETNGSREAVEKWVASLNTVEERDKEIAIQVASLDAAQARLARSTTAASKVVQDEGSSLATLLGKIDPVVAKLGQLDQMQERLKGFRSSGALSGEDYAVYAGKINQARVATDAIGAAQHTFSLNTANTRRELGYLLKDMATGQTGRFQQSLATLASQSGALGLVFSGAGIAIAGVVGVVALFVGALIAGHREQAAFERAVIATGHAAGVTGGQIFNMAERIGHATGQYGNAQVALTKLAQSGKLTGDSLESAGRGAVALAALTGESIDKAVGEFEKLANDPVKAVIKLNEQYHFLTVSVFEHIAALQREGDAEGATAAAMKAAADVLGDRRKQVVDNAGFMEDAWHKVRDAALDAWQAMKDAGRTDAEGQLANAKREGVRIEALLAEQNAGGFSGLVGKVSGGHERLLEQQADNIALQKSLEDAGKATADLAAKEGTRQRGQDAAVETAAKVAADLVAHADKATKLAAAIKEVNAEFAKMRAGGVTSVGGMDIDAAQVARIKEVNAQYAEHSTNAKSAAKAALELANAWKTGENMLSGLEGSLNATAKAQADFDIGTRNIEAAMQGIAIAGGDVDAVIVLWQKLDAALAAQLAKTNAEILARGKLASGNASIAVQLQQQRDKMSGLTAATIAYDHALAQATRDQQADIAAGISAEIVAANMAKRLREIAQLRDDMEANSLIDQFGQPSEWDDLVKNLGRVEDAMKTAFDPAQLAGLQRAQDHLNKTMEERNLSLLGQGISSLQKFAKEGTVAYTALGIAQDILAYKSAIAAIANQGSGDPYSAFARIAAMIALMASIGIRIGGGGSSAPSAQSAEVRQANQGTGSVLGDATAKSESILKATEITANATQQLVGLNRGMLTALQALQSALGAAGGSLARGAGDAAFPSTASGGLFLGLWGESKQIIDQGIVIAGGTLGDMLNKIVVGAYQTIQTNGGLFGGTSTQDQLGGVSDEFSKQFGLVIKSIADTVRAGALALGLLPADVEAAIAAFKVEEIKISLKGLSADEQQKAIEAVFSKLFDGLAGAVVPFIGQFQQVGEGLGETLIRVATEVQVTQEAFKQLGITVTEIDPEKFAQISDALVTAAGGLDAFISGLQSFVEKFAPEGHKFQVESDALTSAFTQVGLAVPATRDGMWELMQSLDATTEAGRAQIATLLRLADVSDQYYTDLEKSAQKQVDYASFIAGLNTEGAGLSTVSPFAAARLAIEKWEQDSIKQANALAKAAGLQGAAEQDLTLIHSIAAHKIADAIAALVDASRSLVDKLYGTGAATTDAANTASSAVGNFGAAMTSAAQAATNAINLLLGSLSPLNDQQKLATAMAGLRAGTVSQEAVLEIGRRLFASSQAYNTLFAQVQGYPGLRQGGDASGVFNAAASVTSTPVLTADEIARQRHGDADQLAQNIASLANAEGKTYAEVAAELHLNLGNLAADLNLSQAELTTYFDQLVAQENAVPDSIGLSTDRIVTALYDIAGRPPPGGAQIPDGHHTRIPGQYADVTATPGPDDNANPPRALSTATVDSPQSAEMTSTLRDVRTLLASILAATTLGSGNVVVAVEGTTGAMRDVDRALQRGADQSGINGRRNDREYMPR